MDNSTNVSKPSLFGIIWSPSEQFERMRERPSFWGALIVATVLTVVATVASAYGATSDPSTLPGVPEESIPAVRLFGAIAAGVTGVFVPVISIAIVSVIMMLIAMIARTEATYKQLFAMNAHIYVVSAIGALLNGLMMLAIGGTSGVAFTSLGSLIDAGGAAKGLLNSIEVFAIWTVVLKAIGLHKLGGLSKVVAGIVAIAFFAVSAIIAMIASFMPVPGM